MANDFEDDDDPTIIAAIPLDMSAPPKPRDDRPCATLTVLTGSDAGRLHIIDGDSAQLGRGVQADLRVTDNSVSRIHARVLREGGGWVLEDLRSQNGTFLRDERVERAELRPDATFRLGPRTAMRFGETTVSQARLQKTLFESSTRDALTGAFNRAYFDDRLRTEISFAVRHEKDVSLVIMDIDHFKPVNDRFGHPAGDEVLRQLSSTVQGLIRAEDVFCRYGGEEFALIVHGIPASGSIRLAERLRASVEAMVVTTDAGPLKVTVSIGVATLDCVDRSREGRRLVVAADERLYEAKREGRNRVVGPA